MRRWLRALLYCPDGRCHEWAAVNDYTYGNSMGELFGPERCLRCGARG